MVLHRTIARLKESSITAAIDDKPKYQAQVKLSSVEFADTEDQIQTSLQIMAKEYSDYFSSNGLKINVSKSEFLDTRGKKLSKLMGDLRQPKSSFLDSRCQFIINLTLMLI